MAKLQDQEKKCGSQEQDITLNKGFRKRMGQNIKRNKKLLEKLAEM